MKKRMATVSITGMLGVMLGATGAFAAPKITDIPGGPGYTKHYIAYEVYKDSTGVNADGVPFFVTTGADIITGAAVNIQVTNGKVNEGAGQLFLSARGSSINLGTACNNALDLNTWYLVGESTSQGVVTPATIAIYDGTTFCLRNASLGAGGGGNITVPAGNVVSTEIGTVDTISRVATTTVKEQINLAVDANLGPKCNKFPTVDLAYVTNHEVVEPTTVLQIIPQIIGHSNTTAFDATLDTDVDFKQFVFLPPSGPNVTGVGTINSDIGFPIITPPIPVVTLIDQNTQGIGGVAATALLFNSPLAPTATTSMSFGLTSAAAEPGVTISYRGTNLNHTNNIWTTAANDTDMLGNITNGAFRPLVVTSDTNVEMNPTSWTLSSFSLSVNDVKTCVAPAAEIGSWAGGLEAYVPFVKTSSNGYETWIKLSNRYKPTAFDGVKLYVAAMNPNTSAVITSTLQIPGKEYIPTNGQLVISGTDLINAGIITADQAEKGTPVKFLIRVPQQLVTLTNDPYITGAVVTTTPTTQRSMNLEFKWNKNGGLVVH